MGFSAAALLVGAVPGWMCACSTVLMQCACACLLVCYGVVELGMESHTSDG